MKILVLIFMLLICPVTVFAAEIPSEQSLTEDLLSGENLTEQLKPFDIQSIDKAINQSEYTKKVSFSDLLVQAVNGQLDLSPQNIINEFFNILFHEIFVNGRLIRDLLLIAMISAVLRIFTESFSNKTVSTLGFYVCYVVLILVLFASFKLAVDVGSDLVHAVSSIMQASLPLMVGMLIMSGSVASAYAFHPIVVLVINLIAMFVTYVLLPVLILGATLQIVNYLTEKDILSKFSELIKKSVTVSITGITLVFLTVLTLQRISAPILNTFAVKTAKATLKSIPVVGNLISGATDTVIFWGQAAKSGALVALILIIIIICAVPVIKLLAMVFIYKMIAALVQPVCDERIVKCIDSIGSFTMLLTGSSVTVVVMFLFAIMIMLSF